MLLSSPWALMSAAAPALAAASSPWEQSLRAGEQARDMGEISASIRWLERALHDARSAAQRVIAETQLSQSLAQSGRLAEAAALLQSAYDNTQGGSHAAIALLLGNVALQAHDTLSAGRYYDAALADPAAGSDADRARLGAALNRIRLLPDVERLAALDALLPRIQSVGDAGFRARALFTVGQLAGESLSAVQIARPEQFAQLLALCQRSLEAARSIAQAQGDAPLAVDADDAMAGLYESQGRTREAAALNHRAIAAALHLTSGQADLPSTRLEWRAARLHERDGNSEAALASYLRAAQHLGAIRQDLPLEDARGRSTYETLQRPILTGLLGVLLKDVDQRAPQARQARLQTALNAIESAHQAELQDYLGERCAVDNVRTDGQPALRSDVAIVYAVVLKSRLDVLVRTSRGVLHHSAAVPADELTDTVLDLRGALLDAGSDEYRAHARELFDWLLQPLVAALDEAHVRELVIVPDGVLRLIPFAVLNDGRQFLAQRYVLSTVTGLSMTERGARPRQRPASLLAGLSTPGPVVDRLIDMGFTAEGSDTVTAASRTLRRSLTAPDRTAAATAVPEAVRGAALRGQLELPGARAEIHQLGAYTRGQRLLDAQFTVARFAQAVHSGDYAVVHVASHGFFGTSLSESFLLAYDDVIRLGELQRLVAVNDAQQPGLELLTLSACDTATGDDRAPLGFAGAGIKARARSVVGSLWAVSDEATQHFMAEFYAGLEHYGKAEAFTRAQRALLALPTFAHPYYWAPFVLTGDWD